MSSWLRLDARPRQCHVHQHPLSMSTKLTVVVSGGSGFDVVIILHELLFVVPVTCHCQHVEGNAPRKLYRKGVLCIDEFVKCTNLGCSNMNWSCLTWSADQIRSALVVNIIGAGVVRHRCESSEAIFINKRLRP